MMLLSSLVGFALCTVDGFCMHRVLANKAYQRMTGEPRARGAHVNDVIGNRSKTNKTYKLRAENYRKRFVNKQLPQSKSQEAVIQTNAPSTGLSISNPNLVAASLLFCFTCALVASNHQAGADRIQGPRIIEVYKNDNLLEEVIHMNEYYQVWGELNKQWGCGMQRPLDPVSTSDECIWLSQQIFDLDEIRGKLGMEELKARLKNN